GRWRGRVRRGRGGRLGRLPFGDERLVLPLQVGILLDPNQRGHEVQPVDLVPPALKTSRPRD
ncbi:MAG: hypothetical protein OXH66_12780, partial [Gemmatimonadetes bacterium]|nr:hypothetical protein [Gemmatimonadota bacterium]